MYGIVKNDLWGSFGYLLEKLPPNKEWGFLTIRDRKPNPKCIENLRQKQMTAGGRNKFAKGTNNKEDTEHEKRHHEERDKKMTAGGRNKLLGKGAHH